MQPLYSVLVPGFSEKRLLRSIIKLRPPCCKDCNTDIFFPRTGLRVLDCECQHLQKMPSCFRMCVLLTCRLQLVATVGFSQAVCWGKASLCYRDETASVLLVGTSWLVLLPWDLPSGQEKPQKQSQKGEGVSGVNVHERCCHSQCWCIQCLCPPWSGTSDGTGEDK